MVKHFCDLCGDEITEKNSCNGRLKTEKKANHHKIGLVTLNAEVMTGKDGCMNDGDFCKYCVIEAISDLDDRDRAVCPECHKCSPSSP